jgi:hypothetical protein
MSLTGDERLPLLYGGVSIALADIPTAPQSLRVPVLEGRPSVALSELLTHPTLRVPLVSRESASLAISEITSYGRTGRGVAAGHGAGAGVGAEASYSAPGVRFPAGSFLRQAVSTINPSPKYLLSVWARVADGAAARGTDILATLFANNAVCNHAYIGQNFDTDVGLGIQTSDSASFALAGSNDGFMANNTWTNIITLADTANADPANWVLSVLKNGVIASVGGNRFVSSGTNFDGTWRTIKVLANAAGVGNAIVDVDLADLQVWVDIAPDMTDTANVEKLVKNGKPVDPAVAALAFGTQTLLFSGDAAGFPTNQGSGGTFTLTGTPTDTDSPSA